VQQDPAHQGTTPPGLDLYCCFVFLSQLILHRYKRDHSGNFLPPTSRVFGEGVWALSLNISSSSEFRGVSRTLTRGARTPGGDTCFPPWTHQLSSESQCPLHHLTGDQVKGESNE
jgi:hypothetical protein